MATVGDTSHLNGTPVQVANDYNNQYNHIQLPSSTSSMENPHDFRHRHNSTGCNGEKRDDDVCTPKRLFERKASFKLSSSRPQSGADAFICSHY